MEKLVRKIGLVAHDAMKKDLIEWVLLNSELLMGHKFYCTGTTGTLILEAQKMGITVSYCPLSSSTTPIIRPRQKG